MNFKQYVEKIEGMDFSEMTLDDAESLMDEIAMSDEITNEEYFELYEIVLNLFR